MERIDGATVVDAGVEAIVVDATHLQVSIDFVYVPIGDESATGTLTLSVFACPTATSPLAECDSRFVDGEIAIEGPGGIWLDRGNSDVSQRGDRRWENLPPGTYHLAANLLQVEDPGYSVARVDGADEYFEGVATIELDTAHPDSALAVVFAAGGPAPVATGDLEDEWVQDPGEEQFIDGDGDHLSDDAELSLGLDPGSPDSDGDGSFDGDEWDLGTDPNDPTSTP